VRGSRGYCTRSAARMPPLEHKAFDGCSSVSRNPPALGRHARPRATPSPRGGSDRRQSVLRVVSRACGVVYPIASPPRHFRLWQALARCLAGARNEAIEVVWRSCSSDQTATSSGRHPAARHGARRPSEPIKTTLAGTRWGKVRLVFAMDFSQPCTGTRSHLAGSVWHAGGRGSPCREGSPTEKDPIRAVHAPGASG
jgi:hypothetical protein